MPAKTIPDFSGIVLSDHPKPGNGWVKGWIPHGFGRRLVIVASHSNPAVGGTVFCVDRNKKRHERKIAAVKKLLVNLGDSTLNVLKKYGDIALVVVDRKFPPTCAAYRVAQPVPRQRILVRDQAGKVIRFTLAPFMQDSWLAGDQTAKGASARFSPGDSGLPWFTATNKLRVVAHTARGMWGEGPNYKHHWCEINTAAKNLLKQ